jgi:hypothetical protein
MASFENEPNAYLLRTYTNAGRGMRLNVFEGVTIPEDTDLSLWKVKEQMVWIKDCPLPQDEVFMRLSAPEEP